MIIRGIGALIAFSSVGYFGKKTIACAQEVMKKFTDTGMLKTCLYSFSTGVAISIGSEILFGAGSIVGGLAGLGLMGSFLKKYFRIIGKSDEASSLEGPYDFCEKLFDKVKSTGTKIFNWTANKLFGGLVKKEETPAVVAA